MNRQITVRIVDDLFAFGKLTEGAYNRLHDLNLFPSFHGTMVKGGLVAAKAFLTDHGLDHPVALSQNDVDSAVQPNWLITRLASVVADIEQVEHEEELRTYA